MHAVWLARVMLMVMFQIGLWINFGVWVLRGAFSNQAGSLLNVLWWPRLSRRPRASPVLAWPRLIGALTRTTSREMNWLRVALLIVPGLHVMVRMTLCPRVRAVRRQSWPMGPRRRTMRRPSLPTKRQR